MESEGNKSILKSLDWMTIGLYLILILWGWISVCGASYDYSNPDILSWDCRSGKQLVWMVCSIGLGGMILLVEKRFYDTHRFYLLRTKIAPMTCLCVLSPDSLPKKNLLLFSILFLYKMFDKPTPLS